MWHPTLQFSKVANVSGRLLLPPHTETGEEERSYFLSMKVYGVICTYSMSLVLTTEVNNRNFIQISTKTNLVFLQSFTLMSFFSNAILQYNS